MLITIRAFFFSFLTEQSSLAFHIPVKMRFKGITFRLTFGNGNMIVRAVASCTDTTKDSSYFLYRISASIRPVFDR